jgi:hypothetical protein
MDSVGESKADEGSSGGVGSYEGIFGVSFLYPLAGTVTDNCNWIDESSKFFQVFEIFVHFHISSCNSPWAIPSSREFLRCGNCTRCNKIDTP